MGGGVERRRRLSFGRTAEPGYAAPARRCIVGAAMKAFLAAAVALTTIPATEPAGARPKIYDPVALNIGVNCQWQSRCMARQNAAMKGAMRYVSSHKPPQWRIQLCNRNASRSAHRVDWIGFENCIRNAALRKPRAR
jgi:hypothetical protein